MAPRILVIDDDPVLQRMISAILATKNYQVETASSVDQSLELIAQQPPDVICCDLMMPKISGLDFLEYCRQTPELQNVPVIVISASGEEEIINQAIALGALACLPKPFSRAQILDAVESALKSNTDVQR